MPIDVLALFAATLFLVAIYPGALVLALVARVLESGWRSVLPFLAAMWLGEAVWLCAAVLGLAALAAHFSLAFTLVKYAGIAYLAWLAVTMWQRPVPQDDTAQDTGLPQSHAAGKLFAAGLALSLGSPEIMVFYLALLPSVIDMASVTLPGLGELVFVMLAVLAVVDLSWVLLANHVRRWLRQPRLLRLTNRLSAAMMGLAAVLIALRS